MIALLQRVMYASVKVDNKLVGEIQQGLLVFVGVEKEDAENDGSAKAKRLVERVLNYRMFADKDDKMNLSVRDIDGGVLCVSQFTLAADTKKGNRPSFTSAAEPEKGKQLYNEVVNLFQSQHNNIATGQFGADMQVELINDGPVTFWLQV